MALCTGYWDRDVFLGAADAVTAGGMLGWEAFTARINNWGPLRRCIKRLAVCLRMELLTTNNHADLRMGMP